MVITESSILNGIGIGLHPPGLFRVAVAIGVMQYLQIRWSPFCAYPFASVFQSAGLQISHSSRATPTVPSGFIMAMNMICLLP